LSQSLLNEVKYSNMFSVFWAKYESIVVAIPFK